MRMSWRWTPTDRNVAIESNDVQAHEMFAYARLQWPSAIDRIEAAFRLARLRSGEARVTDQ